MTTKLQTTMTEVDTEWQAYLKQDAIKSGAEAIDNAIASLQRDLAELRSYKDRYTKAQTDVDAPKLSQIVNWTIGRAVQSGNNMRIDLLADAQAKLAKFDN